MKKSETRWPEAHVRLQQLYKQRVGDLTQKEFGERYGIGTAGMVWQYLNGYRPLNVEAAARFAKGLRCTIEDISPEMANALKADILPYLSPKHLRRVATLAILALGLSGALPSQDAHAKSGSHNARCVYFVKLHTYKYLTSAYLFILLFAQYFRQISVL